MSDNQNNQQQPKPPSMDDAVSRLIDAARSVGRSRHLNNDDLAPGEWVVTGDRLDHLASAVAVVEELRSQKNDPAVAAEIAKLHRSLMEMEQHAKRNSGDR